MDWLVPLSDIDLGDEEIDAVTRVLRSRWLSMGESTEEFETQVAAYLGVAHAIAVSNGTTALHLAYRAAGITPGDEVILPSLTFVATANGLLYLQARPIFAEITSASDLTIGPASIEQLITPRTRAIVVMHYGGYPCDMSAIQEIARKYGLIVIEDAAHAPGMRYKNEFAGTLGDVACFSFFANKNMVTGEGGMLTTNRDDIAIKARQLRSHGMTTATWDRHHGHAFSYDVIELGYNYRLDELRAALGLVQLKKLARANAKRSLIVQRYRMELRSVAGLSLVLNDARFHDEGCLPSYHLFPILLDPDVDRTAFMQFLKVQRIQSSIHYPPIHLFSYYRQLLGFQPGMLPLTERVSQRLVTLPLFSTMTDEQCSAVIEAVASSLK